MFRPDSKLGGTSHGLYPFPSKSFAVTFWAKKPAGTILQIVTPEAPYTLLLSFSVPYNVFVLHLNAVTSAFDDGRHLFPATAVTDGRWHHFVVTLDVDEDKVELWVDGKLHFVDYGEFASHAFLQPEDPRGADVCLAVGAALQVRRQRRLIPPCCHADVRASAAHCRADL